MGIGNIESPGESDSSCRVSTTASAEGANRFRSDLLVGLAQRRIVPDLILFADTGSEKRETTAYLDVIGPWLDTVRFPPVVVVKRASPRAGDASLHAECLRKSVLPSLAYGVTVVRSSGRQTHNGLLLEITSAGTAASNDGRTVHL